MKRLAAFLVALVALLAPAADAQFLAQGQAIQSVAGTNTVTGTLPNASSYADVLDVPLIIVPANSNTGAATLNLNSFGTSPAFRKTTTAGLAALTGNELVAGVPAMVMFDGTYFDILSANTATLPSLLPQGYLTPCQLSSGSPVSGCTAGGLVPTGDVLSTTALYYEPGFGNGIPIYNGTNFVNYTFSELTLSIPSSRLASTLYDVFIFLNSGTPTICFGPAWTSSTSGSSARGTGASTTQIGYTTGVLTNTVSMSCVNGSNTYTGISANQATYIGTCLIDTSAGQVSFDRTWGSSRKWACWNAYNQQDITLKMGSATTSWTYSSATVREADGQTTNFMQLVVGWPNPEINVSETQLLNPSATSATTAMQCGLGLNSTTAFSGTVGEVGFQNTGATNNYTPFAPCVAALTVTPFAGLETVNALEAVPTFGTGPATFYGTETDMLVKTAFRG
jgi:hypothetical protein